MDLMLASLRSTLISPAKGRVMSHFAVDICPVILKSGILDAALLRMLFKDSGVRSIWKVLPDLPS